MGALEPVVAIAHWKTDAASAVAVLALVAELRQRSLEEPGCLAYEVLRSVATSDVIVLLERYADAAALEAHRSSQHYRELLVERILPLLSERRIDLLRPLEAPARSS
ncbi:MAG: putative quinol monooxygenase [Polyangiaceae bacterium]